MIAFCTDFCCAQETTPGAEKVGSIDPVADFERIMAKARNADEGGAVSPSIQRSGIATNTNIRWYEHYLHVMWMAVSGAT